ncbi:hypothetical protein DICVIV_09390 [Dictyocaulus viviparus]|uniref:Uncharacterized protein n=1 Tax=Dictyocaulus viviparus TaxID=29172 RepID=A0A0D8XIT9_DICVI|nr:hypothetical protein DICVIV_09390 [Dictyocaulus viviparus]
MISIAANEKITSELSPTVQSTGRISCRVVRPSSRFVNSDFVSPLRNKKLSRTTNVPEMVSIDTCGVDVNIETERSDRCDDESEGDHSTSVVKEGGFSTHIVQPGTSKPTLTEVPHHIMETRRRSKGKKTHGVKIRLKIFNFGNFPRVRVVEDTNYGKVEGEISTTVSEPMPKKKTPVKKYISPWSRYKPSVKPVLGNVYYSDGSVEKLGVSVNAVMDRLLAEVCQDGITRHSAIVNKREKRKRNIEKARQRVHRLKEERAAREAQGYVTVTAKSTRLCHAIYK